MAEKKVEKKEHTKKQSPVIKLKNVLKYYYMGDDVTIKAVDGIDIDVYKGDFIAVMGPSGSGKSTTFHQISLLDIPTSGKIKIGEKDIINLNDDEKTDFRLEKIGYVFQHYELLPELTAIENIYLPLMVKENNLVDSKMKAEKILGEMGLIDRKDHFPSELSGGEKQRVAIARALIKEPEIILADEPTANLDSVAGKKVMDTLTYLNKKKGITIFVINHEKQFEKYFDRIIRLKDGKIIRNS